MSYAQAAAQGPNQSRKEHNTYNLIHSRAPQPPEVEVKDADSNTTSSLIDVDSPHVATVPSNFEKQEVKTSTQAERLDRESEEEQRAKNAKAKGPPSGRSRAKSTGACDKLNRNKSNPVVIGNTIVLMAAGAGLAYGAYHKHVRGGLTWELVAKWSGGIGALGLFDYYVSKWFFQNKYPPK